MRKTACIAKRYSHNLQIIRNIAQHAFFLLFIIRISRTNFELFFWRRLSARPIRRLAALSPCGQYGLGLRLLRPAPDRPPTAAAVFGFEAFKSGRGAIRLRFLGGYRRGRYAALPPYRPAANTGSGFGYCALRPTGRRLRRPSSASKHLNRGAAQYACAFFLACVLIPSAR